jgi:hypothetical protein
MTMTTIKNLAIEKAEAHGWEHCFSPVGTVILARWDKAFNVYYITVDDSGRVKPWSGWEF